MHLGQHQVVDEAHLGGTHHLEVLEGDVGDVLGLQWPAEQNVVNDEPPPVMSQHAGVPLQLDGKLGLDKMVELLLPVPYYFPKRKQFLLLSLEQGLLYHRTCKRISCAVGLR